ncbi:MAG: hypothetical protein ACXWKV_16705, partial [Caulobacteraceae bacterium]
MSRIASAILGTVALSAAVFVSGALHAQPAAPPAAAPAADPGNQPYAPFKIGEGLYYVGASDYSSYLIVTKDGLIVIDGGDQPTGAQVVGNIKAL